MLWQNREFSFESTGEKISKSVHNYLPKLLTNVSGLLFFETPVLSLPDCTAVAADMINLVFSLTWWAAGP